MKCCVAVLTRGYADMSDYYKLIKRNQCIVANLNDKSIDLIIFHEGNITEEHQQYIQNGTPGIQLKFIDVSSIAFLKDRESIPVESGHGFGIGYRHMCSFWFVDFWEFVKEYDYLLRIDEDCFVEFNIDRVFRELVNNYFIAGDTCYDCESVTVGLNEFSRDFVDKNKLEFIFKSSDPIPPHGPYTNVFAISLNVIKENESFRNYVYEVDASKMIYRRRWGDLPLWGEAIFYIFGSDSMKIDKTLKYFHESHGLQINP
jgi:hypothetical protein